MKRIAAFVRKLQQIWSTGNPIKMADSSTRSLSVLDPPDAVQGMIDLKKELFCKKVEVPYLCIPTKDLQKVSKHRTIRHKLLRVPNLKAVREAVHDEEKLECKEVFLNPEVVRSVADFDETERCFLEKCGVELNSIASRFITLKYENWNYNDVLRAILPQSLNAVGGYSKIGHIVHLNLEEELHPYKHLIGNVLLDKVPGVRTVVNKTSNIDSTFRFFQMEVIAGEEDFITVMKEHGVTFKMDFSKVYWNPRLSTEHNRVIKLVKKEDIVFDVFAGIGPFAIPMAKKGCQVFANDLNPDSVKWLRENIVLNKVKTSPKTYILDGREFIQTVVKQELTTFLQNESEIQVHIIMNLPAIALEFLNEFNILLKDEGLTEVHIGKNPMVYCYCFTKESDPLSDIRKRAEEHLGCPLQGENIHFVRNVAPNKNMYCLQFSLLPGILLGQESSNPAQVPPLKKLKQDL